jgi:hypothetical protein
MMTIYGQTATCACEPDLDDSHFGRLCDYCGTESASLRCIHDGYQDPCPECAVLPLVQPV